MNFHVASRGGGGGGGGAGIYFDFPAGGGGSCLNCSIKLFFKNSSPASLAFFY